MNMDHFLKEVEHAVVTVMAAIHEEHENLRPLQKKLVILQASTEEGYSRAQFLSLNPDLDDEGLGTAAYWDTYFGPDRDLQRTAAEIESTNAKIITRRFSVSALSGSLLQYAKQGLSASNGKDFSCLPAGRLIGRLPLHEVILQGRNQAMHWEDGAPHPRVIACFDHLATHFGSEFSAYRQRNLAYEVVNLLGWRTVLDFNSDMRLYS